LGAPRTLLLAFLLAASGCGREAILHGLDEGRANHVIVALDEAGVAARKERDDAAEGSWRVEVSPGDAAAARRILAERELPRRTPPGFGEVFGKGSVVPTPSEERALYLHALCGELARSLEAIDGVVEARVHVALPSPEVLRPEPGGGSRAAVLVRTRSGARAGLERLAPGIQSLVAGAVQGLDAAAVAVVIAEAPASSRAVSAGSGRRRTVLALAALALAGAAIVLPLGLHWRRFPWARLRAFRIRPS
jgi:type III secretion protein J